MLQLLALGIVVIVIQTSLGMSGLWTFLLIFMSPMAVRIECVWLIDGTIE